MGVIRVCAMLRFVLVVVGLRPSCSRASCDILFSTDRFKSKRYVAIRRGRTAEAPQRDRNSPRLPLVAARRLTHWPTAGTPRPLCGTPDLCGISTWQRRRRCESGQRPSENKKHNLTACPPRETRAPSSSPRPWSRPRSRAGAPRAVTARRARRRRARSPRRRRRARRDGRRARARETASRRRRPPRRPRDR